jgi:hypothetical protein
MADTTQRTAKALLLHNYKGTASPGGKVSHMAGFFYGSQSSYASGNNLGVKW